MCGQAWRRVGSRVAAVDTDPCVAGFAGSSHAGNERINSSYFNVKAKDSKRADVVRISLGPGAARSPAVVVCRLGVM